MWCYIIILLLYDTLTKILVVDAALLDMSW